MCCNCFRCCCRLQFFFLCHAGFLFHASAEAPPRAPTFVSPLHLFTTLFLRLWLCAPPPSSSLSLPPPPSPSLSPYPRSYFSLMFTASVSTSCFSRPYVFSSFPAVLPCSPFASPCLNDRLRARTPPPFSPCLLAPPLKLTFAHCSFSALPADAVSFVLSSALHSCIVSCAPTLQRAVVEADALPMYAAPHFSLFAEQDGPPCHFGGSVA